MYLTTTFSPMMMDRPSCRILEISLEEARELLQGEFVSRVAHETTVPVLQALVGPEIKVSFSRENVSLTHDDKLVAIIPSFRTTEAREFSFEEVAAAGFRCFHIF